MSLTHLKSICSLTIYFLSPPSFNTHTYYLHSSTSRNHIYTTPTSNFIHSFIYPFSIDSLIIHFAPHPPFSHASLHFQFTLLLLNKSNIHLLLILARLQMHNFLQTNTSNFANRFLLLLSFYAILCSTNRRNTIPPNLEIRVKDCMNFILSSYLFTHYPSSIQNLYYLPTNIHILKLITMTVSRIR